MKFKLLRSIPLLTITVFLVWAITCCKPPRPPEESSALFGEAEQIGIINDLRLNEISGMSASIINKGRLWCHNDSGNDPVIYLISQEGTLEKSYWIKGAINRDWEDMALISTPGSDRSSVLIGDIGDNFGMRTSISVIRFPEPSESDPDTIYHYDQIQLTYPDGAKDAETLFADPVTSNLIIITKRDPEVRVYKTSLSQLNQTGPTQLEYAGNLPITQITGGDISVDGKEILLKSYTHVYYWKRGENTSIYTSLNSKYENLAYDPEPQGEAICWDADGAGYYTLSERVHATLSVYYYRRLN